MEKISAVFFYIIGLVLTTCIQENILPSRRVKVDPSISCIWFRGLTAVKREKFAEAKKSILQSQGCLFENF